MSKKVEEMTEEVVTKKVTYNEAPKNEVLLGDEEEKAKSRAAAEAASNSFDWKTFWDKVTTGLLIALMASPFIILAYIFVWFIFR